MSEKVKEKILEWMERLYKENDFSLYNLKINRSTGSFIISMKRDNYEIEFTPTGIRLFYGKLIPLTEEVAEYTLARCVFDRKPDYDTLYRALKKQIEEEILKIEGKIILDYLDKVSRMKDSF